MGVEAVVRVHEPRRDEATVEIDDTIVGAWPTPATDRMITSSRMVRSEGPAEWP